MTNPTDSNSLPDVALRHSQTENPTMNSTIKIRNENDGADCIVTAICDTNPDMGCRYFIREYKGKWCCFNDVCFPTQLNGHELLTVGRYATKRNAQLAAIRDISKHALI